MKKNIVKEIVLLVIFCLLSTTMTFAQSLGREKISQFLKTYEELIVDVEKLAEKNSVNEFLKFQQKYVELSEKLTEMQTMEQWTLEDSQKFLKLTDRYTKAVEKLNGTSSVDMNIEDFDLSSFGF